jgi:hypothetical protein
LLVRFAEKPQGGNHVSHDNAAVGGALRRADVARGRAGADHHRRVAEREGTAYQLATAPVVSSKVTLTRIDMIKLGQ